jgi:hypothetical protein
MPPGIGVAQGVVVNVRVTIERLWVPGLGHDGIRLQEAAQGGVVEAGLVIIQAQALLPPLAGEAAVGGEGSHHLQLLKPASRDPHRLHRLLYFVPSHHNEIELLQSEHPCLSYWPLVATLLSYVG